MIAQVVGALLALIGALCAVCRFNEDEALDVIVGSGLILAGLFLLTVCS
jgi:hypothetical protein